ncbi:MAG: hypothetical protein GY810_03510 [Aureispira sp.]|nr:hypothetical protein [Aureispira sp.]
MKTSHWLFTLSLVFACFATAFAQSHKIVQQKVLVTEAGQLSIEGITEGDVKVQYTKGKDMVIKTQVRLSVKNNQLMSFLVDSDRYELTAELKDGEIVLSSSNHKESIDLGNEKLREYISYTICVPENVNEIAFIDKNERNPWQKVRQARKAPKYWVSK